MNNEYDDDPLELKITNNLKSQTLSRVSSEGMYGLGEPIASCFMFNDTFFVFSTDQNYIIGIETKTGSHFHTNFKNCFATCLDFESSRGILVAGLSNNIVTFINPRKFKFEILKSFVDFSLFPLVSLKIIDDLNKVIMSNTANEILIAERKSSKNFNKYKIRQLSKIDFEEPIVHDIKIENCPEKSGSIIALISVNKIRLVWILHGIKFKAKLIDLFSFDSFVDSRIRSDLSINHSSFNFNSISLEESDLYRVSNIFGGKKNFDDDFVDTNKKNKKKKFQMKHIKLTELKLILKKKNRALLSEGGIFLIKKILKEDDSSCSEIVICISFQSFIQIRKYCFNDQDEIIKAKRFNLQLENNPIWGCFMGNDSILIILDNFDVNMIFLEEKIDENCVHQYGSLSLLGMEREENQINLLKHKKKSVSSKSKPIYITYRR